MVILNTIINYYINLSFFYYSNYYFITYFNINKNTYIADYKLGEVLRNTH